MDIMHLYTMMCVCVVSDSHVKETSWDWSYLETKVLTTDTTVDHVSTRLL